MRQMGFWLAFAAVLTAFGRMPAEPQDASELLVAQILCVDAENGAVYLETDCGASGSGGSVDEAFEDLKQHAAGAVFLETAEFVVLSERARYLLPQLAVSDALRPATRAVCGETVRSPQRLRDFLRAHPPQLTLGEVYARLLRGSTPQLPRLTESERGLSLA